MNALVQNGINQSKLEISLIKIDQQEPDSFVIEIKALITNTGPIGATMAAMTVDLIGPIGVFGVLDLPKLRLAPSGTSIHIEPQTVGILNHDKFQAFVKSIQLDERTKLSLYNPKAKVSAMFMSTEANFSKTVEMNGMNGPKIELVKTSGDGTGDAFENTIRISNPSPLEIFIPQSTFHYLDEDGKVVAEQYGEFNIVRGVSEHDLPGKVVRGNTRGQVRLIGKEVKKDSWMKKTITYFNAEIALTPKMIEMMS